MQLEFKGAGAYRAPRGLDYPLHRHGCWELVYYREGHPLCSVGDEWYSVHPGVLLLTPPTVPHMERAVTGYANYFVSVEAPAEVRWPVLVRDDGNGSLQYIFRQLVTLASQGTKTSLRNEMMPLLLSQLEIWLRHFTERQPVAATEKMVLLAERLLEERFAEELAITDLAATLGVAPSSLRANFMRFRGYSPKVALRQVRMRRALELLRSSDLTLNQVATACGFYSASHLARHVKRETGEGPGRLRAFTAS